MKFRLPALAGFLAAVVLLAQMASASDLYVSNRVFREHVTLGGQMYVPLEGLLKALGYDWKVAGKDVTVAAGGKGEGTPVTEVEITLRKGSQVADVAGILRGDAVWVPLRAVAPVLGVKVLYSEALDTVDVVAAREITAADEQAAQEVAAAREAREKAVQDAWQKRRDQIRADREAREKAAAEAAGQGQPGPAGPPPGGGEGSFPPEMAGTPPQGGQGGPPPEGQGGPPPEGQGGPPPEGQGGPPSEGAGGPPPEGQGGPPPEGAGGPPPEGQGGPPPEGQGGPPPAGQASAGGQQAAKPAEKPKEAKLIVIRPNAVPDYFTGKVAITASVKNNGYAPATNVRADVVLTGPDGIVWDRQTLRTGSIDVDGTWNLTTSWTHNAGASMPRGVPTVKVDLTYDAK